MCGLSGIIHLDQKPVSYQSIKAMTDALAHRGPDGEGVYIDKYVGLGHRRLAILDTSERGAQPMQSKSGDWIVVFNGCIYNYLHIKSKLQSKGYYFHSSCDTEVICEGLDAFGPKIMEDFDGMFAIAAWHKSEQTLYLSRDRYGVKPLYYVQIGKTILFASEIKSFLTYPEFKVKLNQEALNEYFTFQNLFSFQTLFEGVTMLPPANTVKITSSSSFVKHNSWWDYDFTHTDSSLDFEESINYTKDLFHNAVSKQMLSDVPVGSYLSGGMDSGSIAVSASKHVGRLMTFTCGFDMSGATGVEVNYDERRDAELTANFIKSEHFEQVMNAGDIRYSLSKLVWQLEDLRVGMSYPNYYIARLASKFVKVCLQGTGGDELFGGYPWRYYKIFKSSSQKDFFSDYYNFWQRLVPDQDKSSLFQDSVFKNISLDQPRTTFERVFLFNNKLNYDTPEDHINNSLYFEIKTFLPALLLVGDKLSMAHGLEERFPFLDNDLVQFAQKVPIHYKLGQLELMKKIDENELMKKKYVYSHYDDGKNILRKAMKDIIPAKIVNRVKQGFSAPDESWYRGENADYVKELLLGKNIACHEFIRPEFIKKTIHEHCDLRINHRLLIWSLLNFEWWCRIFLNGEINQFNSK
ncbi:MAG TPA: asparagine synthase (glutamine-hydrolyzing) [Saprospiraceae bacterium]|nr:asparagine synthase (glutamine-hydrolyzing) [Saprospiraceae bacterium]